ncbi:alpha/beta hydrolase [Nocardia sp. NPDC058058]|uniref:alpha/beta hydrolase n=1 Tax=Nocardia sp. NPDC058058 TaxID=3346317 RepID=UPI0036DA6E61
MPRFFRSTLTCTAVAVTAIAASGFWAAPAFADPGDPVISSGHLLANPNSDDGSSITGVTVTGDRTLRLQVFSAAMQKNVEVDVQRPADPSQPAPALYLLNGGGGGEDQLSWTQQTDALNFMADKQVNVILPVGGRFSYYTDWRAPDPVLGVNEWKTFFTAELPPLIDAGLGTTGANAIAGLSTSGTSVLQLAIAKPGLFRSVAAYSGCAQISDPIGHAFVNLSVDVWGGGDTFNMYGPQSDPMWAANDPYLHADALRGTNLFVSSGTGVPGQYDFPGAPHSEGSMANQLILGGGIEAAVNWCTHNLADRLQQLSIPATFDFQPTGTHSWGYWQDALRNSWPVLAAGLGVPA